MIAMLPLILALGALACAAAIMVRQARSAGRRVPAASAGEPLFFARYRPGPTELVPPGSAGPVATPPGVAEPAAVTERESRARGEKP